MEFEGKKILVLGAGISGISVAVILENLGAHVTLSDAKPEEEINKDLSALRRSGVSLALGNQNESLIEGIDLIVLSPGISIYIPLIGKAKEQGIPVMSEIEVAYRLCRAPIFAITGTNGKTTTTTLTGEMVKTTGKNVVVGGNIGQALSAEVASVSPDDLVVAEISSFQLEGASHFRPHIAAVLNVTPDHLDRHRSMETYILMKKKIFANQTADDYLILNYDDPVVREMAKKAPSHVCYFSRKESLANGVYVEKEFIKIRWQQEFHTVCNVSDIQIKGAHNVENALAACGIAFFAGVKIKDMARVLNEFQGVEHRIEPVGTVNDISYYNDSKATNPESAIKALEAFPGHVILIAGGRDKKTDLKEFMQLAAEKTDHVILLGEAAERFNFEAVKYGVKNIHRVSSMQEAILLAHRLAQPPQVVLLSPACSSYDMFNNYEERGEAFKKLVKQLR